MVKNEGDPLDPCPPPGSERTNAAARDLERAVTVAGGIALRYGNFYGEEDAITRAVRQRRCPVIGNGAGYTSWIHVDGAVVATVLAPEESGPAIDNIVDDEPAPARVAARARPSARRKTAPPMFPSGSLA
jgi:nucleoside-diphosphate-sugar epimerase